jgi:hypothetical protein
MGLYFRVYIITTATTGVASHRNPAFAKNTGHFETLLWNKKFKCMTKAVLDSQWMQATCVMKLRRTGVQFLAHCAGTMQYKMYIASNFRYQSETVKYLGLHFDRNLT